MEECAGSRTSMLNITVLSIRKDYNRESLKMFLGRGYSNSTSCAGPDSINCLAMVQPMLGIWVLLRKTVLCKSIGEEKSSLHTLNPHPYPKVLPMQVALMVLRTVTKTTTQPPSLHDLRLDGSLHCLLLSPRFGKRRVLDT